MTDHPLMTPRVQNVVELPDSFMQQHPSKVLLKKNGVLTEHDVVVGPGDLLNAKLGGTRFAPLVGPDKQMRTGHTVLRVLLTQDVYVDTFGYLRARSGKDKKKLAAD